MAIYARTATFTGVEESVVLTWPALNSATPGVSAGVCVSDGLGVVDASITNLTATGCTVTPSGLFTGTVEVIAKDV